MPFAIAPPQVAVLPFENLSAAPAPLKALRESLIERLRTKGANVLEEERLRSVMARHRIRYTGGIGKSVAEALRREAGTDAVLINSLELYMTQQPPKVALASRLVGTGDPPVVVWADSVALSGDDSPGFLDLGVVKDAQVLASRALDRLAESLARHLLQETRADRASEPGRFGPREFYRSPILDRGGKVFSVAVLPVLNQSERKFAGEILALHLLEQLAKADGFEVLDTGAVRDELLQYRIVSPEGASLDVANILFSELGVELLVTGKVMDYEDGRGFGAAPRVTFFVQAIERQSGEVVWASHSTNRGDEGVFFFGLGAVRTGHELASRMVAGVVRQMRGDVHAGAVAGE